MILSADVLGPIATGATRDALTSIDVVLAEVAAVASAVPGHHGALADRALVLPGKLAAARNTHTGLEAEVASRQHALEAVLTELSHAPVAAGTLEALQQASAGRTAQAREVELGLLQRQLEARAARLTDSAIAEGVETARRVATAALAFDAPRLAAVLADDLAQLARHAGRVLAQVNVHEAQVEAATALGADLEAVPTVRLPREALQELATATVTLTPRADASPPPAPSGSWLWRGRPGAIPERVT